MATSCAATSPSTSFAACRRLRPRWRHEEPHGRPGNGRRARRRLVKITAVETRRYAFPLDPPFRAAWDPVPREQVEATLVAVRTDEGLTGYASGDALPDA